LRIMFLQKLKTAAPVAALALGLVAAAALAAAPHLAAPPAAPPAAAAPAKKLAPAPSRIVVWRNGELVAIDPDGKNEKVALTKEGGVHEQAFALSPDGTLLAVVEPTNLKDLEEGQQPVVTNLFVYEVGRDKPGTDLGPATWVHWSPDGKQIAVARVSDAEKPEDLKATHEIVTLATKARTPLKLPDGHVLLGWPRAGEHFLTGKFGGDLLAPATEIYLVNRDGTEHRRVTAEKLPISLARAAPDGDRVLWMHMKSNETPAEKAAREGEGGFPPQPTFELKVLDVATGKSTTVAGVPAKAEVRDFAWSPGGKSIAYTWREALPTDPNEAIKKEKVCHLSVCDADGKNHQIVLTVKGDGTFSHPLDDVDWQFVAAEEKPDAEKLAGRWKMVSVTDGGKDTPTEGAVFTFEKDKVTVKTENQTTEAAFKLDPAKAPKWIDFTVRGETMLGVYELDGDTLKICLNEERDGKRPTKLASEPNNSPNDLLWVLKREK